MTKSDIEYACEELTKKVPALMKNHLKKMYVYGSSAREDFNDDSDVDVAILTDLDRESVKRYDSDLMNVVVDIAMNSNAIVEYICLPLDEFETKKSWYGYFKNIEKDGVVLYG